MSVKLKIVVLISISVILPIVIISLLIISNVREQALDSFEQRSLAEITHIDNTFSLYLHNLAENAAFFAQSEAITQLTPGSITSYADAPAGTMTPMNNSLLEQQAFQLMDNFGKTHPDLTYIWLGTNDSGYLQWPSGDNTANYNPLQRDWYRNFTDSKTPTRVPAYADAASGAPLIDYVQRFDGQQGLYGVVGVDVSLKKLTELLTNIKFGGEGYVVMVEDTGTILVDPSDLSNNFKPTAQASRPYSTLVTGKGIQTITIDGEIWYAKVHVSEQLKWKFIGLLPSQVVYAQANQLVNIILIIALIMVGLFITVGMLLSSVIVRSITLMAGKLEDISHGEGDLTQRLAINSRDESSQMAQAFNAFVSSIDEIVGHTKSSCIAIGKVANNSESLSNNLSRTVTNQLQSVEQVSTAFNDMVSTANNVAENCSNTAMAAENSEQQVQEGHVLIEKTLHALTLLEQEIQGSNDSIILLSQESNNIVSILDTIKGIAEQTNLLALNAAIEAARAGEQGRGFAVVADEVRTLAGRTAESTDEVDKIISNLQKQTRLASDKMGSSVKVAKDSVGLANQTYEVFKTIHDSIMSIKEMTIQISVSAEEQHHVAEDINVNVTSIHDGAQNTNQLSDKVSETATKLTVLADELQQMVERFKSS